MRAYRLLLCLMICWGLILLSCGMGGGGNPVGVTGGSIDGYGESSVVEGSGQGVDNLTGAWTASITDDIPSLTVQILLTINTNGTYSLEYTAGSYNDIETGTYEVKGNQIIIDGEAADYTLSGNTLTLYMDEETIVFTRVSG